MTPWCQDAPRRDKPGLWHQSRCDSSIAVQSVEKSAEVPIEASGVLQLRRVASVRDRYFRQPFNPCRKQLSYPVEVRMVPIAQKEENRRVDLTEACECGAGRGAARA